MKQTKHKNKYIALMAVLLVLSAALWFIAFGLFQWINDDCNEANTTEYQATVNSVKADGEDYIIQVNEYPFQLRCLHEVLLDQEALSSLQAGENVSFRLLPNVTADLLNSITDAVIIVSLQTEETELITLDSYNQKFARDRVKITIAASVGASICLIGAVVCLVKFLLPKKDPV